MIALMSVFLLLMVGIAITIIVVLKNTKMAEIGTIFRNNLYGLYYKDDVRIDEGIVEIRDTNVQYNTNNDINTETEDNHYAMLTTVTDKNPNYETVTTVEPIVDDDGYARLPV